MSKRYPAENTKQVRFIYVNLRTWKDTSFASEYSIPCQGQCDVRYASAELRAAQNKPRSRVSKIIGLHLRSELFLTDVHSR